MHLINNDPGTRNAGMTLLELLVAIFIVGILVALLLPSVTAAREAARRAQCSNNLRQMSIALHNYAQDWNSFPPNTSWGRSQTIRGWAVAYSSQSLILKYFDANTFNSLNFALPGSSIETIDAGNATVSKQSIASFLCPSDFAPAPDPTAKLNYRANSGLCEGCRELNQGAFVWGRAGSLAAFSDGLSNTIVYSEKLVGSYPGNRYQVRRDWVEVKFDQVSALDSQDWVRICSRLRPSALEDAQFDAGGTWMIGGAIYSNFFVSAPPNSPIPDCGSRVINGHGVFAARSRHPGGVNVAIADGSVRWIHDGITPNLWRALGTSHGGEVSE